MLATTTPPVRNETARLHSLRVMKRRATGLLVVMAVVFVVVTVIGGDGTAMGYVRAGVEASLVGGLADWFAVTALFRHPLGVPIPHTAIIKERKDQFGQTLGAFVQENFLTPETVAERVRTARVAERLAAWLCDERNADLVAGYAGDAVIALADVVRDEDVQRLIHEEMERAVDAVPVARIAARGLRMLTEEGRHQELFDVVLRGLDTFLEDNRETLRQRFALDSPWWLPGAAEDRIFERLLDGVRRLLDDVNDNPEHEVRAHVTAWANDLADRLETSPELTARGDQLKRELLEHPELRKWSASMWTDLKARIRAEAGDEQSALHRRVAGAVRSFGARLRDDATLQAKADEIAVSAVRYVADHFHDEIGSLVTSTVARWDADETSHKLELLLGPDLQFIRINGTVIGGLAGVLIHGAAQLLH
jgi:uncharacterized membrane-anchored protein YjiN (DUF445 family)